MSASGELHVVFRVADVEYVVAARQVAQMESYGGATRVPGTARHVIGVVQVRGQVVPVVDLRVRFGLDARDATPDSRLVVVRCAGDRRVALLVDAAREVVRLAPEQLVAPPAMVSAGSGGLVRAIAHLGPRIVMLVDADGLVGQEQADGA